MEKNIFSFGRLLLVLLLAVAVSGLLYWAGVFLPENPKDATISKDGQADFSANPEKEPGLVAVARNISVDSLVSHDKISSPLKVRGRARGSWFSEGVFPIQLIDGDNQVLASGQAKAQGEWMTENFVEFTAELAFIPGQSKSATLILFRDNPSGLPENAEQLEIPVGL